MANYAYVSLTYAFDLEKARQDGVEIPFDPHHETGFAKQEFIELLDSWKGDDLWNSLEVELE